MTSEFDISFKNNLAAIIRRHNELGSPGFGNKLGESIVAETKRVCDGIDPIKNSPDLLSLLRQKFKNPKICPNLYKDNGCYNCEGLFFEHSFEPRGAYAAVGFYVPSTFKTQEQKTELCLFTKNGLQKCSDPDCIEFYFAVCELPIS